MKEWPKELLEIFDDPLLANVRPAAPKPTANDRSAMKLEEVSAWIESNGREPQRAKGDLCEKRMAAALAALRSSSQREALKPYYRLNLLEYEH